MKLDIKPLVMDAHYINPDCVKIQYWLFTALDYHLMDQITYSDDIISTSWDDLQGILNDKYEDASIIITTKKEMVGTMITFDIYVHRIAAEDIIQFIANYDTKY